MDRSQVGQEWSARASRRIAADPAFAALEASGAPIFVAAGDALEIVYLNASARAVFGGDAGILAARLFGGTEPGGQRLAALIDSVRENSALRLERLRLAFDAAPQTVTVLCRRLLDPPGPVCFAVAALGVRPSAARALVAVPAPPVVAQSEFEPKTARDDFGFGTDGLRARLAARHGGRSPRFLWKTDADGRFIDVTHILGDVVGEQSADILGRSVAEVAADLGLGAAFPKAVAARKSWSGVHVAWPLDHAARVPATLGALPVMDAARRFAGFQGYGVLHLDRAFLAEDAAGSAEEWLPADLRLTEESEPEEEMARAAGPREAEPTRAQETGMARDMDRTAEEKLPPEAPKSPDARKDSGAVAKNGGAPESGTGESAAPESKAREAALEAPLSATQAEPPALIQYPDNIVRLRPPTTRFSELENAEGDAALSSIERSAFDEIARALREGGLIAGPVDDTATADAAGEAALCQTAPEKPAPEEADWRKDLQAPPSSATPSAPPAPPASQDLSAPATASALEPVLDRLPVGVLVARGARTLFINRTLLDYLGYADPGAFEAEGGLARMFFGRAPGAGDEGARSVAVQASDGGALDADAHLQIIDWEGAPATLLTLRRSRFKPKPGPEETALGLARELEEKLSRARAEGGLYEAAFNLAPDATAIIREDGRIEKVNAAFADRIGAEPSALEGHNMASLILIDCARALAPRLPNVREKGEQFRLSLRGRVGPLDAYLRRLDAQRIAIVLREPIIRGNDELEAARLAAESASAAKSDFLARISHEIRTPLNAIIGFAEVMMEERLGPIGSDRYKEYLRDVHASGAHVLSLVNDLLDLSKIEAGKLELEFDRVDANAVISECASLMQTQANRSRVLMRLALAPQLPQVRADRRSIKQILLNLLSNAVKFNEPGGQVIVSSALTDTGAVVIRVKDTGIGMSDEEVLTALEPFKQIATRSVSPQQRGTGLGLPLTKALIEANHASFTIQSRKNEGTLIEVVFPPPQVLAAE